MTEIQKNLVSWFEIPVSNMDRAIHFYEHVFDFPLDRKTIFEQSDWAYFPNYQDGSITSGMLILYPQDYKPRTREEVLIYFNAPSGDVQNELDRVVAAKGEVTVKKTRMGNHYIGVFHDTEGNCIGLRSSVTAEV